MHISPERLTVTPDQNFVVFLIGTRVNKWWMLPFSWGIGSAMGRMMRELASDPESGLMSCESYVGRTTLMVQYWRSLDALMDYAKDKSRAHVPAWRQWIQKWANGAFGIWHETYVIEPGNYESVYHHMPAFGLGKVGPLVPATGELKTARGRLSVGARAREAAAAQAADHAA